MRIVTAFALISFVSVLQPTSSASASMVATRSERESCPYWKAVGVLSDHIELACGGERSIRLNPVAHESPALACCPEPYGRCSKEERVPGCDEHIVPILAHKSATTSKE